MLTKLPFQNYFQSTYRAIILARKSGNKTMCFMSASGHFMAKITGRTQLRGNWPSRTVTATKVSGKLATKKGQHSL